MATIPSDLFQNGVTIHDLFQHHNCDKVPPAYMLFRDWQDFVTYPLDPNRVRTKAARLNTSGAFRRGPSGDYSPDYAPSSSAGAIVDIDLIVRDGDLFEAMEVTDYGDVLIWTRQKVWLLLRKNTPGIEKLIFLPRHPNSDVDAFPSS